MTKKDAVVGVGLSLGATIAATLALGVERFDTALASALTSLFLLLLPLFLLGITSSPPKLATKGVVVAAALLLATYLIYGWGTGVLDARALVRLTAFVSVPTVLVLLAGRRTTPSSWDFAAVLAIWLPFDFRLLEGIWTWPEGRGSYGYQALLAVDLALVLFLLYRAVPGIGYRFRLGARDLTVVVAVFLVLSAVAIPVGLAIDFIAWQNRDLDPLSLLGSFVAILIFIGIPEELLFRGLIQSFLETKWGKNAGTLLLAAAIFGAAHLNNGEAPNWPYAFMATLAGVFYGLAYRMTGSIFASALVHALVDAVWRAFFR